MTLVKICGIRELEHARVAAGAGASLIGFVFVPVRREVKPDVAREIVTSIHQEFQQPPATIGLFVNETAETINRTVAKVGLDLVQLHGDEPPGLAAEIDVPAIKALRVGRDDDVDELEATISSYLETFAGVHIDSHVPGQWGGTGVVGDWDVARRIAENHSIVLAGGLSPDNVSDAIERVRPAVVDVSSGVETEGRKDPAKIRAFIQRACDPSVSVERPAAARTLVEVIDSIRARNRNSRLHAQPGIH